MKNFRWLLILLLVTGNIVSCGPRDRAQSQFSQDNIETQAESGNPNNQEDLETQNTDSSERAGRRNFPLDILSLLIVTFFSVGSFLACTQLKSWIETGEEKSRDFRKRSSETIKELNQSIQNLEKEFEQFKKQISSDHSQSSFSAPKFQEKQQYQIREKTDYPHFLGFSQPASVVQQDPYQEVITAFNNKDTTFFRQNTYYLALDESTLASDYTSTEAKRIVKFFNIDNPRDALCLAVILNSEYLLIPNFFSPYYANLDQWLSENNDIFDYQGHGQTIELIKPGIVQYSQSENGIWNLIEPCSLLLFDYEYYSQTKSDNKKLKTQNSKSKIKKTTNNEAKQNSLKQDTSKNQQLISAFNIQSQRYFRSAYLVTINYAKKQDTQKIYFNEVEQHRDAEFMIIEVDNTHLLVPDFMSPYYQQFISQETFSDTFNTSGSGKEFYLKTPAQVEKDANGNWLLTHLGECLKLDDMDNLSIFSSL
ncbi:hypothetical protein FEK30_15935 (plasmid) [Picosynechococcus sp. PCC 11901]|uniref:hypothetical protein n=1 Tax=Picosynechococcus sp. PCC 11901 TaxID=2579791 RepID=UPI0010FC269A|nr:hypothetical protein [Picosynechococcus sp. PCC 11901]QCS51007.1 hypothetical protein FEK30_15935 [Picosynechococcus sp. PCC 11901]